LLLLFSLLYNHTNMNLTIPTYILLFLLFATCHSSVLVKRPQFDVHEAICEMLGNDGTYSKVFGTLYLNQEQDEENPNSFKVSIHGSIEGLPRGRRSMSLREFGDVSDRVSGKKTGPIYNPTGESEDACFEENDHPIGALGDIKTEVKHKESITEVKRDILVQDGSYELHLRDLFGRSIVIHEKSCNDDESSIIAQCTIAIYNNTKRISDVDTQRAICYFINETESAFDNTFLSLEQDKSMNITRIGGSAMKVINSSASDELKLELLQNGDLYPEEGTTVVSYHIRGDTMPSILTFNHLLGHAIRVIASDDTTEVARCVVALTNGSFDDIAPEEFINADSGDDTQPNVTTVVHANQTSASTASIASTTGSVKSAITTSSLKPVSTTGEPNIDWEYEDPIEQGPVTGSTVQNPMGDDDDYDEQEEEEDDEEEHEELQPGQGTPITLHDSTKGQLGQQSTSPTNTIIGVILVGLIVAGAVYMYRKRQQAQRVRLYGDF